MLKNSRWTSKSNQYLIAMESLKLAIAMKEMELREKKPGKWESAVQYYRIWSFSGYLGAQKSRG